MSQPAPTKAQVAAFIAMVKAVADAIRELGEVPSGHLYGNVMMQFMDLHQYNRIIGYLADAKLIKLASSHLITWIGPEPKESK